ncbi:hypothetical protein C8J57DRAFT_1305596 [Mycena rebaudengoi]|nr:hypothetical protein C8J57DRAFT_1305596 [Mycena rebaudengoi]
MMGGTKGRANTSFLVCRELRLCGLRVASYMHCAFASCPLFRLRAASCPFSWRAAPFFVLRGASQACLWRARPFSSVRETPARSRDSCVLFVCACSRRSACPPAPFFRLCDGTLFFVRMAAPSELSPPFPSALPPLFLSVRYFQEGSELCPFSSGPVERAAAPLAAKAQTRKGGGSPPSPPPLPQCPRPAPPPPPHPVSLRRLARARA